MNRGAATVAIIGRPNTGKSTLFNRFVGNSRAAIVDDRPGSTRDRHFGRAEWNGRAFWLVDTGGLVPGSSEHMDEAIRQQVDMAVDAADVVVFLADATEGPTPGDQEITEYLRRRGKPVVLAVNKADDLARDNRYLQFFELGIGEPTPVSAATGKGSGDLLDLVVAALPEAEGPSDEDEIAVAVIGRPNVGKSSLVNKLLGEERHIVSAIPGTTRDAIDSPMQYQGRQLTFVDTAGLRKRGKIEESVEFYSLLRTERALERADVCVLVIDGAEGLHGMDIRIAGKAWDEGRGLIVAVNKWDLIKDKTTMTSEEGRRVAVERAPFLDEVPFVFLSAKTGQRATRILELVLEVADARRKRVSTSEVNKAIGELTAIRQPPQAGGSEVKLFFGTQVSTAPPTFAIVSSRPDKIPEHYERYLVHGLRERFGFTGSTIRLKFRARRRERAR